MRHIVKGLPPSELTEYLKTPGVVYKNAEKPIKNALRRDGLRDQHGVCCYCCGPVADNPELQQNEHLIAQTTDPTRTLDSTNLLVSCASGKPSEPPSRKNQLTCDDHKSSDSLPISPLDPSCESHFRYVRETGAIVGTSGNADAIEAIRVLNLDCARLRRGRLEAMGEAEAMLGSLGADEWAELFSKPVNGLLTPFEPAVRTLTSYNRPLDPET